MRIRLFGFNGNQVHAAEAMLRKASESRGQTWSFVSVFEMLEVARKNIPPDGIGVEADNVMVFRGCLDEAKADALTAHILDRVQSHA